ADGALSDVERGCPLRDVERQLGRGPVVPEACGDVRGRDALAGATREEAPGDQSARAEVLAAGEDLLQVDHPLVPPDQPRGDLEALPEGEGAPVAHGLRRDDRV